MFVLASVFLLVTIVQSALHFGNNACEHLYDYPLWFKNSNCYYLKDIDLENDELITNHGYKYEKYELTTSDGYILTLWRIASNHSNSKPPVFVQHGIMTNSRSFVNTGNQSLAFYLADLGYDVWLGNFRGSKYSRRHILHQPTESAFWNYKLDDLAEQDLPAQINFVANKTGKAGEIIYIGHSMGTTSVFMAASTNPAFQHKLKGIVALSPVCYLNDIAFIGYLTKITWLTKDILLKLQIRGFGYQSYIYQIYKYVCRLVPYICLEMLKTSFGPPSKQFPMDYLLLAFANLDGVAVDQILQYVQIANSRSLRKFDHGRKINLEKYGRVEPPQYNLSNINIPVHMYYGSHDVLSTKKNVKQCFMEIDSERKTLQRLPIDNNLPGFNHIEIISGAKLTELFYPHLSTTLKGLCKNH